MAAGAAASRRPGPGRPWSIGRGYALLLVAPVGLLVAFFVAPLALVVGQSVSGPGAGLGHFAAILGTPSTMAVVTYTFQVALTVTVAALLLGYPVAYVASHARGRWLVLCIACILLPFWTSTVIRTYAWVVILQRRGILNDLLLQTGLIDRPLRLMNDGIGMQIGMVHIMLPFMILPLLSSMRGIDGTPAARGRRCWAPIRSGSSLACLPAAVDARASAPAACWCSSRRSGSTSRRPCSAVRSDDDRGADRAAGLAPAQLAAGLGPVDDPAGPHSACCSWPTSGSRGAPPPARSRRERSALPWRIVAGRRRRLRGLILLYLVLPTLVVVPLSFSSAELSDLPAARLVAAAGTRPAPPASTTGWRSATAS